MNEERLLPTLLTSIRGQTVQPKEVVVADAHSKDATRDVARSFGARVVDGGLPSVGRNRGAAVCTGDVLLFLDADVALSDAHFFSRLLHEFETRHLDIASADVVPQSTKRHDHFWHWVYNTYVRLWGARNPHTAGILIVVRRALHEKIGGFDEGIIFCEDHEYASRATRQGRFGILNAVRVSTSTRRYERDGRLRVAWMFLRAELHLLTKGPIRDDRFHYTFGYDDDSSQEK